MARRSVTSDVRRISSLRGKCALVALTWMLLALVPISVAQDLRLQPAEVAGRSTDESTTSPEQSSTQEPDGVMQPDQTPATAAATSDRSSAPSRSPPATSRGVAAASAPVDLTVALDRPGTLNLHDVELRAALFMISDQWGINVVCGDVKGTVNGVFRQAPLREILDSILLSNGYNYRAVGESLVVSTVAELGQINPFFQSATISVHSADIDEVVQGARLLTTPQGQIQAIKSARSIVVLDFPDRVKMIRDFVTTIDDATRAGMAGGSARVGQPLEVGHFRTQHIAAKTAEDALAAIISKDGRIAILEKEDRLLISDYAENLEIIAKVLERIDRPRPQVRITALIYDISLSDLEQLGISWGQIGYRSAENSGVGVGIGTQPAEVDIAEGVLTSVLPSGANMAFGALSRHFDIAAVAKALKSANDARLLADPSVAVLENEQAVFKSVQEIPIQQLTQTGQGGQIGTTTFREAGIKLTVIPKIAADGTIRMHVSPEFSRQNGVDSQGQPIIDTRFAETVLNAANRQTIVIAGLRQREDLGEFSGVPYLKDIRGVGKLFRSRNTTVRESELVVFISAEIISPADPLNHREVQVVDTIGCRLNQIPEAEGCPPPPCLPPFEYVPFAGPVRLPATEQITERAIASGDATAMPSEGIFSDAMPTIAAAQPPFVASAAIAPAGVRRLPSVDQLRLAAGVEASPLFAAPQPIFGPPSAGEPQFQTGAGDPANRPRLGGRPLRLTQPR